MISNLVKIKKFNESSNMDHYNIFVTDVDGEYSSQSIISMSIIEDFFSLLEIDCEVVISICVMDENGDGDNGFHLSNISPKTIYNGRICYNIQLGLKNIDRSLYIDHGDSIDEFYIFSDIERYIKVLLNLKSIDNKLKSLNHSLFVTNDNGISCIITNNEK